MKSTKHKLTVKRFYAIILAIVISVSLIAFGFVSAAAFYGSLTAVSYTEDTLDEPVELQQGQIWTGKRVTADANVMTNGIFNITLAAKVGVGADDYTQGGLTISDEIGDEFDFVIDDIDNFLLPFTFDGSTPINALSTDGGNTFYYTGGDDFFTVTFNAVNGTVTLLITETYLKANQGMLIDLTFGAVLSNRANVAGTYDTNGDFKATFKASANNPFYLSVVEGEPQYYTNTPSSLGEPSDETSSVWGVCRYSFTTATGHWEDITFLGVKIGSYFVADTPPTNLSFDDMYVNPAYCVFDVANPGSWQLITPTNIDMTGPYQSSDDLYYYYTYHVTVTVPDVESDTSITHTTYSFSFRIKVGKITGFSYSDFGGSEGWTASFGNVTKTVTTTPKIAGNDEFNITDNGNGTITVKLLPPEPDIEYTGNAAMSFTSFTVTEQVTSDTANITTLTRTDPNHLTVVTDTVITFNNASFDGGVTQILEDTGSITLTGGSTLLPVSVDSIEYGTLTVDKMVSSADTTVAVDTEPFTFTVTFSPSNITGITNSLGLTGVNGVYTFTLSAGAPAVIFTNIPTGTQYTVTEAISSAQDAAGWEQGSVSGAAGTITTAGATALFENVLTVVAGVSDDGFENEDDSSNDDGHQVAGDTDVLPQTGGIASSTLLMFLGLTLVAIGGTALLIMKKKRAGDNKS